MKSVVALLTISASLTASAAVPDDLANLYRDLATMGPPGSDARDRQTKFQEELESGLKLDKSHEHAEWCFHADGLLSLILARRMEWENALKTVSALALADPKLAASARVARAEGVATIKALDGMWRKVRDGMKDRCGGPGGTAAKAAWALFERRLAVPLGHKKVHREVATDLYSPEVLASLPPGAMIGTPDDVAPAVAAGITAAVLVVAPELLTAAAAHPEAVSRLLAGP